MAPGSTPAPTSAAGVPATTSAAGSAEPTPPVAGPPTPTAAASARAYRLMSGLAVTTAITGVSIGTRTTWRLVTGRPSPAARKAPPVGSFGQAVWSGTRIAGAVLATKAARAWVDAQWAPVNGEVPDADPLILGRPTTMIRRKINRAMSKKMTAAMEKQVAAMEQAPGVPGTGVRPPRA